MPDSIPTALVTGGAKRVGRAIVEKLGDAGYAVVFTYLGSADGANEVVAAFKSKGRQAIAVPADLTQPSEALAAIRPHVQGRLDVLVNNASLYAAADLAAATLALSRKLMAIHHDSPLLLCQAFAPLLRASKGHIVNMVDLQVERPNPAYLPYCASKAALANLTTCLARSLAPDVTVNGIAPGVVEWPPDATEDEREKYMRRVPLARAGSPGDVANLVHFLCTTGAYINGQIIHLDGGRSIT